MSDAPVNPAPDSEPKGEPIPLEPLAPAPPPPKPTSRSSILQIVDDKCPNCGARMEPEAVVCMSCGYDMKANELLKPLTGVDIIEPPPVKPDFVKPGGKPAIPAGIGAVVVVAAMVAAAVNSAPHPAMGASFVFALLILYRVVVHTATGMVGLWCTAKFVDHRLNRPELAAARMFLALGVFMLIWSLRIPIESAFLEHAIRFPLAVGGYWLALFALFRRSRLETTLIALFHLGAMMFVELGLQLGNWLETSVAAPAGR